MFKKITYAFFALLLTANIATAKEEKLSDERIKEIVRQVIAENGDLLAESMSNHMEKERRARAAALIKPETPLMGPKDAKITIVEFSDYRCGFCKRVQNTLAKLREEYKDSVQFAFKTMPILSKESEEAALAALAANRQGKFWEFNTEVWENQSRLGAELFEEIADTIKLDKKRFVKDLEDPTLRAQVAMAVKEGQAFGAEGTPFFLIDGMPFGGAQPYENFVKAIEGALKEKE